MGNYKMKTKHLDKVAVRKKFRRGRKRNKKHQSESTTNFATFELRPIVYKMRIPFLILCLAVVYGSCRVQKHEESTDLFKQIQNNGDYKLDYANMPLERLFVARHKRANLLTPITFPIDTVLYLFGCSDGIISQTMDLIKFTSDAMIGRVNCPKVELSFGLFVQAVTNPFQAVKTIICYIAQTTGSLSSAVTEKAIDIAVQFLKYIFLPGLHTTLNKINESGIPLPPQIRAMILAFDAVYKLCQFFGFLPK